MSKRLQNTGQSLATPAISAEQKTTTRSMDLREGPLTNGHRPTRLLLKQPIKARLIQHNRKKAQGPILLGHLFGVQV